MQSSHITTTVTTGILSDAYITAIKLLTIQESGYWTIPQDLSHNL